MLVSIGVGTYNSSKTILETLKSIYDQTYKEIELIVSDDCSSDDTVSIVRKWLDYHKSRFVNTRILTVKENTGIPANCNRLISHCNGEWIKLIAGDDLLLDSCIEDYMDFVTSNLFIEIAYSPHVEFETQNGEIIMLREMPESSLMKKFDSDAKKQLDLYLTLGPNITPTLFMKRDLINKLGGFSEKYKSFEDSPFITKVLKNGIKIWNMKNPSVLYRVGNCSVSKTGSEEIFYNVKFMDCLMQFRKTEVSPLFPWYKLGFWTRELSRRYDYFICTKILNNKKTKKNIYLHKLFSILNPMSYFSSAKRIFNVHNKRNVLHSIQYDVIRDVDYL